MEEQRSSFLSTKEIPPEHRLIVALDGVPEPDQAIDLVRELGDSVHFYKIGLELFVRGHYLDLIDTLVDELGKKVFADFKISDVPNTVACAVRHFRHHKVNFATIHPGSAEMYKAAVSERNGVKILVVTALTSLDQSDLRALGYKKNLDQLAYDRAVGAIEAGCDGVIASGYEASNLRKKLGDNFLIVTPGIRDPGKDTKDDHKRTVTVEEAFHNGADYIVVGRPIRCADNPKTEAERIQDRIRSIFPGK